MTVKTYLEKRERGHLLEQEYFIKINTCMVAYTGPISQELIALMTILRCHKTLSIRTDMSWQTVQTKTRSRGYKNIFMLNSAELEIFLLINVKMPTIVGILTFISRNKSAAGIA